MITFDQLTNAINEALADLQVHYPCVSIGTVCLEIGSRLGMNSTEHDMFKSEVHFRFLHEK